MTAGLRLQIAYRALLFGGRSLSVFRRLSAGAAAAQELIDDLLQAKGDDEPEAEGDDINKKMVRM